MRSVIFTLFCALLSFSTLFSGAFSIPLRAKRGIDSVSAANLALHQKVPIVHFINSGKDGMVSVTQDGPVIRGQWSYNQFTLTFVYQPSDSGIHFTLSAGIPAIGIKALGSNFGHLNKGAITADFKRLFSLTEESGAMSGHVTVSEDAGYMRVHLVARGNYFREMDESIDVLSLPRESEY